MKGVNLSFRITKAEKLELERIFEGQNLSKVIRDLLLGDQVSPRQREKTIAPITL